MSQLRTLGTMMLYGTLLRALPLIEDDTDLRRQALSLQALCEDRLKLPRSRPERAGRRGTSEEARYGHE
jgi:hypothetical protein